METTTCERRTRYFERQPIGALVITERDLEALSHLDELRLMNSHQLRSLFGNEFARDRLKRLYHHGYIDRVDAQRRVRLLKGGGSEPLVLALTNKGAKLLKAHGRLLNDRRDWSECNRLLKPSSLAHPLAVAEVAVAFEKMAEASDGFSLHRLPHRPSLLAPGREASLIPDLVHEIVYDDDRKVVFFVEVDCGTEPNSRHPKSALQSLRSKFEGYLAYARSGLVELRFSTKACRILTVVTGGEKKRDNVARVAGEACGGVGVDRFLVATMNDIQSDQHDEPIWRNAELEGRELL